MKFTVYNPGNSKPFNKRAKTVCIIAHHAAAKKLELATLVLEHKNRGFNGAGYNWYIRKDGTIYQLRPIWAAGAHTIGWNSVSVGICCEGNYDVETDMPEVQLKAYAEVIDYINDYYKTKLPVYGHRQKWPTACPGRFFPFAKIVSMAAHWDDKPTLAQAWNGISYKWRRLLPTMKGTYVRAIQQRLKDLGLYTGLTDGSFGRLTDAAVRLYQRRKGLKVDGVVGPATWKSLFTV